MSSPPRSSEESSALFLPSLPPSSIESSPFSNQILQILVLLHRYPAAREIQEFTYILVEYCNRALDIVQLQHEQVLLAQNLITSLTTVRDLSSSEVQVRISELEPSARKTEELTRQLHTDFSTLPASTRGKSSLMDLKSLTREFESTLSGMRDIHAYRKSFMAEMRLHFSNAFADDAGLERLRSAILRIVPAAFPADFQDQISNRYRKFLINYQQLDKLASDDLEECDEKLSQHVVDLVLEWNRNRKED